MPSILNDGPRFFPNVLGDPGFRSEGVLFGHDPGTDQGIHWAVVDPRRHVMYVWQKSIADFPNAAKQLGASVVTNAPFLLYPGAESTGGKVWAHVRYHVGVGWLAARTILNWSPFAPFIFEAKKAELARYYFTTSIAEGFILGARERIREAAPVNSRPRAHYFGRQGGRLFANYAIAQGDPPAMEEVIGGLFRSVDSYAAVDTGGASWVGTWGLAPVRGVTDGQLVEAGVEQAARDYELSTPDLHDPCAGLLVAVFATMTPATMAALLAGVRVKDAVRLDGNDSILMGHHGTLHYGDDMPPPKRAYNRYGYRFARE